MAVALLAMMQVMMFAMPTYISVDGVEPEHQRLLEWASLTLTLPAILYSAAPFFRGAWRDLRLRRPGMDVPVALGLARGVRRERLGDAARRWRRLLRFGDDVHRAAAARALRRARSRDRRAGDAVEARGTGAPGNGRASHCVARARTKAESVGAASLDDGDMVLVRAGGVIPADGEVVDGRASVEEAILTGESRPRAGAPGDAVLAGSVGARRAARACA